MVAFGKGQCGRGGLWMHKIFKFYSFSVKYRSKYSYWKSQVNSASGSGDIFGNT